MNMNARPLSGPDYLLRGFTIIRQPGIRLFVAIPLLINFIIFGAFTTLTLEAMSG